ncbi:hypothetical protein ACFOSV_13315 [Algoriphagus namhaensis]|uniref:Uncharacterized protein n=1 Tax=Algoriphagus namhaensis TaxID=915353 RepID=A0ABV8AW49_9BACT
MKFPSLAQLKKELKLLDESELQDLLVDLSKFSRDNKAYLFFKLNEREQPNLYVEMVQEELENEFSNARSDHYYYAKKSAQKIRRKMNKLLKLTKDKSQQVEIILYFCERLKEEGFLNHHSTVMDNLYQIQLNKAKKLVSSLHEDLQYDLEMRFNELE